jgi:hypothetical protein
VNTELATYEEKNIQMSMIEVISIIIITFGVMHGMGFLNFLYDYSLYPWYVDHLIPPFTFCTIIVMYAPARKYCSQLVKSLQFNDFKHYVTIVMTMIILLIYLAVLNLVLPHGLSVDESNIVIEPTISEIILYVVVLTIFAPIWEELLFRGIFFHEIISALLYTY